jgi:hypothetical protein
VLWILSRRRPVVLPNFTMCAEHDRIRLSREARLTYRPAIPHDANPRHVRELLDHIQQLWCALTRWRARVRRAQGGSSRPGGACDDYSSIASQWSLARPFSMRRVWLVGAQELPLSVPIRDAGARRSKGSIVHGASKPDGVRRRHDVAMSLLMADST